jgi:ParB-like chromosome segregation protein Spo0J
MTTATDDLTAGQQQALAAFQKFDVWKEARLIPIDNLEFCDWNVNEMSDAEFSELVAEVEEGGFDEPALIIPLPESDRYLVPSGEHRTRAAIALEMTHIPCVLKLSLTEKDEQDIKMWTVKRNNIRGRVNETKYRKLEQSLSEKYQIRAEAARQRMLVRKDLIKALEGRPKPVLGGPVVTADDLVDSDTPSAGSSRGSGSRPETDGEADQQAQDKNRGGLERSFKAAWEQSLMDSADTVEHGYLFFGENEKLHLVVNCSDRLIGLVKGIVGEAKNESTAIDGILCAALSKELESLRG